MTASSKARPKTAADHVRELVRPFTTVELVPNRVPVPTTSPGLYPAWIPWPGTRVHHVQHLPLLSQVEQTVTGSTMGGGTFSAAYGSKPAGRIETLAFLERLERQSAELAVELGLPRLPLRARLARIGSVLPERPHRLVKAWWVTARVLTQHDGPPFSPDVPCGHLECSRRGTMRVRPTDRLAVCVECHTVWTDEGDESMSFARLTLWIRWASEHLKGLRHWVPATVTNSGYGEELGYQVECTECVDERLYLAQLEAERLRAARPRRRSLVDSVVGA